VLAEGHAVLARAAKGAGERTSYLPAALRTGEDGRLFAEPLKWGGSSDFVAFAHAEALVIVPQGMRNAEAGSVVKFVRLPG
jgi:molybdopterin biosynthesis enzyme